MSDIGWYAGDVLRQLKDAIDNFNAEFGGEVKAEYPASIKISSYGVEVVIPFSAGQSHD